MNKPIDTVEERNADTQSVEDVMHAVAARTMRMDLAWDWPAGVAFYGLARASEATGLPEYVDFLVRWSNERLKKGLPKLTVNAVSLGHMLLYLAEVTGEERYLAWAAEMADFVTKDAQRFGEGVLQHTVSQNYNFPGQAWADTLFMAALFLLRFGIREKRPDCVEDALKQYYWHEEFLQDRRNNLYYHAWDNLAGNNLSGIHWARANAWAALTFAEALRLIDAMNPAFMRIGDALRDQLEALVRLQTGGGLWRTVLDDETAYEETSASAGIGAALAIYSKVFHYDIYDEAMTRALSGVVENVMADGTVKNVSAGTAVMADAETYKLVPRKRIQGWGQGLVLAFLAERVHQGRQASPHE